MVSGHVRTLFTSTIRHEIVIVGLHSVNIIDNIIIGLHNYYDIWNTMDIQCP